MINLTPPIIRKTLAAAGFSTLLLFSAKPAHALSSQGVDFTSIGTTADFGSFVVGYRFTVNGQDISVDQLGYFDNGQDGLLTSHNVGIFRESDQNLLISAIVPSGTTAPLTGFFRYVSISPTVLNSGQTYRIGGTSLTGFDRYSFNNNGFTVNPAITYNSNVFTSGSTLVYPNSIDTPTSNGFAGGNFTFTAATPVPFEFSPALGLGILGGAWLIGKRFRKKSPKV